MITLFLAFLFSLGSDLCYSTPICREIDESKIVDFFNSDFLLAVFVSPPIFLFSLITYRMKEEIFRAWWNFARWMVPIIILATIIIQFMPRNGGFFNMDSLIYLFVLAPLYAILILVSLWRIFRTYRKLKKVS